MSLDHAQNLRIGQKGASATPGIQIVTVASLPEVAYRGQMVYALDIDQFRVYNGDAWSVPTAAAAGGTQTFVGATAPVADHVGDLWMKNTTYQLYVWDGAAWQEVQDPTADAAASAASAAQAQAITALNAANAAQVTADGKVETFYQASAPVAGVENPRVGDLWFRTTDNRAWRYSGSAWIEIQDQSIVTAISNAGTAQATADQKISSYYQTTAPWPNGTAGHGNDIGDLWFDTDDNNKPYRWDGNWTPIQDGTIAVAQSAANTAQTTADLKKQVFFQTTAPTGGTYQDGDTWFDTDDGNRIYKRLSGSWVAAALGTAAVNFTARDLGGVTTTAATSAPSSPVTGDIWIDTTGGANLFKRWSGSAWVTLQDAAISAAQTSANGKNTVYYQTAQPTGGTYRIGDTWFDTDDGFQIYVYNGTAWTASQLGTNALADLSIVNAKIANGTIQDAKIGTLDAAKITTGTLDANRIGADSITAAHIAANAITASELAANAVTAAKILAGTITANELAAGSVTTTKIAAGAVTANEIATSYLYAGTISVSKLTSGSLAADVLLAATMRTGLSGARVEIGPVGINIYGSAGTPVTTFPSDGSTSTFAGNAELAGLTVTGGASLRGASEISQSAVLNLAGQVTPPQAPPLAVIDYESGTTPAITGLHGLTYQSGTFYAVSEYDSYLTGWDYGLTFTSSGPGLAGSNDRSGGLAKIGSSWYTIGATTSTTNYLLNKYSATGILEASLAYTRLSSSTTPCVGVDDAGQLITADCDPVAKTFRIQIRNATSLAVVSTYTSATNAAFTGSPVFVQGGSFDLGAFRYVLATNNGTSAWVFSASGSSLTLQSNDSWLLPQTGLSGMTWDGTRFFAVYYSAGKLFKFTTVKWSGTEPAAWLSSETWRDTNATGGTHETPMSPVGTISMRRRARLTLSSPTITSGGTDDPNAVSFYLSNTTSARTSMWLQTLPADLVNTLVLNDTIVFTGTNPPATNNFPAVANPGKIQNAAASLAISGDGTIAGTTITASTAVNSPAVNIGATPVNTVTQNLQAVASSNVDLTATEVDITGATLTFTTVRANAKYLCTASFYFSNAGSVNNSNQAHGKLSIDGSVQTQFANYTASATPPVFDRTNSSQTWVGTLATAGSHTFKLRGVVDAAVTNAIVRVNSPHTTITVTIFE